MDKNQVKRLLKLLVAIFIITFLLDKLIYQSLNLITKRISNGESIGELNYFFEKKDSLELIVFGSSRAQRHINPNQFTDLKGFNMGIDGHSSSYYMPLIKLLPPNKKQIILINLDIIDLYFPKHILKYLKKSGKNPNHSDIADMAKLNFKYHKYEVIKKELDELKGKNWFQQFYWLIDYNQKLEEVIESYNKPNIDYQKTKGFEPYLAGKNLKEVQKKLNIPPKHKRCPQKELKRKVMFNNLKKIINFCKTNNKLLVFYTSPLYENNCISNNHLIIDFIKPLNVSYLDYSNLFTNHKNIDLWRDKVHLSERGAITFTDSLIQDVEKLFQNYLNTDSIPNPIYK